MMPERRLPKKSVCRRLEFGGIEDDQAVRDNTTNILKETINQDRERFIKDYNFDTATDTAYKGTWLWYVKIRGNFVEMEHKDIEPHSMQYNNENTPARTNNASAPSIRKRKSKEDINRNSSAKKKVDF